MFVSTVSRSISIPGRPWRALASSRARRWSSVSLSRWRHHARLPEPTAVELLVPARQSHERLRPGERRPHGSPETLREADAHAVEVARPVRLGDPGLGRSMPQPRPVEMGGETELAGRLAYLANGGQRPDRAPGLIVGVLDAHEPGRGAQRHRGPRRVRRHGSTQGPPVEDPPLPRQRSHDDARPGRGRARLPEPEVCIGPDEHLVARACVRPDRDLVGHRPGRHEHGGLFPEHPRHAFLERPDRGIVAVDVIPHRRRGDRRAHRVRGTGDRVRAEVDHGVAGLRGHPAQTVKPGGCRRWKSVAS